MKISQAVLCAHARNCETGLLASSIAQCAVLPSRVRSHKWSSGVIAAIKKVGDDVLHQHDADGNIVGTLHGQMQLPIEADAVKRSIGRNTRYEADPELEDYANSSRKAMYGSLNEAIESAVDEAKPGTSIKALNGRYANLI